MIPDYVYVVIRETLNRIHVVGVYVEYDAAYEAHSVTDDHEDRIEKCEVTK